MAACARCAPGKVSTGVGRLTMRNLGTLVEIINADTKCGFESEVAKDNLQISAPIGSMGTGTWRIDDCLIELPASDPYVSEDCNGVQTRAWGVVSVTAERKISGVLSGDDENPVIPGGPDNVTINILRADFSDFRVEVANSDNAMTWEEGSISGQVAPRLAVDDDLGACSFVTSHAALSDVRYGPNTRVYVDTADRSFGVDVDGSGLFGVNGVHLGRENELWGSIRVWGSSYDVPDDGQGLDPDYNPDIFPTTFECKEGLSLPVRYDCDGFLGPILAQNTSRITMRLIGRVVSVLEDDVDCGFSSPEVLGSPQLEGQVGGLGAATFTVNRCILSYPEPTAVSRDCEGNESVVRGQLVVSGTKRLEGRLTGNLETPVIPMSDNPAVFEVAIEAFEDFDVSEADTAITVHGGTLTGRVEPRVAADTADSGACSYVSDIVRFSEVRWGPSEVTLRADEGTFAASIQQSDLRALNGYWGGDTNLLRGQIVLDETAYQLPTDPQDDGLDPEFDRAAFDAAWQCKTLEQPVRFDCAFNTPLAQGAAQLGVQTFGMMATLLEADERCGFSSQDVLSRVTIDGPVGFPDATAIFRIDSPCELSYPEPTIIDTDCNGINTYAHGKAWVTGTMIQVGIASGDPNEPIVPTGREPAALDLSGTFDDFAIWTDPGANILTIKSGRLTGSVAPRVGIDRATGACSIITPVARFRSLRFDQAPVILEQDDRRFDVTINRSNLTATNGDTETATNRLTGELTMDGTRYSIPAEGEPILNPDYDQTTFDRSYACLEGLQVADEEADCNMKQAIGEGVARLMMLAVGTLAAEVNADDACGFEDFWVTLAPDRVEGDDGEPGLVEWNIENCELRGSGTQPNSTDCLGGRRFMDGRYSIDAKRTVSGTRDTEFLFFASVIPDSPESVVIELKDVRVENYRIFDVRPGETEAYRAFEIEAGHLAGIVEPILGENAQDRGTYDIPTPVVRFSAVQVLQGFRATVLNDGKIFRPFVNFAQLEGFNGSYAGLGFTNYLSGQIDIDGTLVNVDLPLDPDFEQVSFDESYACTTDLVATIVPE